MLLGSVRMICQILLEVGACSTLSVENFSIRLDIAFGRLSCAHQWHLMLWLFSARTRRPPFPSRTAVHRWFAGSSPQRRPSGNQCPCRRSELLPRYFPLWSCPTICTWLMESFSRFSPRHSRPRRTSSAGGCTGHCRSASCNFSLDTRAEEFFHCSAKSRRIQSTPEHHRAMHQCESRRPNEWCE